MCKGPEVAASVPEVFTEQRGVEWGRVRLEGHRGNAVCAERLL